MPTKQQVLKCFICYLCYYFSCVSIGCPAPFLPKENERHAVDGTVTGMMMGCRGLMMMVGSPFIVKIINIIGTKNTMVLGTICIGITTAAFGCIQFIPASHTGAYTSIAFALIGLLGLGNAASLASSQLMLMLIMPEHTTLLLSIAASVGGVGIMSGPAIGSGFFVIGGFWAVFAAIGGLLVITAAAIVLVIPTNTGIEKSDCKSKKSLPYLEIFSKPRILISYAAATFSAAKWYGFDPILEPELSYTYGLREEQSALVFLLLSSTYALITPIAGKVIGQPYCVDSLVIMGLGLLLNVILFLFAGPLSTLIFKGSPHGLPLLLVCLCLMGISNCLLYTPAQDIIFKLKSHNFTEEFDEVEIRGLLTGFWQGFYSLGSLVGMTVSATEAEYLGWSMTMTLYSITSAVFVALVVTIKVTEKLRCCFSPTKRDSSECANYSQTDEKEKLLPCKEIQRQADKQSLYSSTLCDTNE